VTTAIGVRVVTLTEVLLSAGEKTLDLPCSPLSSSDGCPKKNLLGFILFFLGGVRAFSHQGRKACEDVRQEIRSGVDEWGYFR